MGFCKNIIKLACILTLSLVFTITYLQVPRYNGKVTVSRSDYNEIIINRNSYGVPVIKSENFNDIAYGTGYAHAQDRIWSMEFRRKVAQGRLSEFAGKQTLRTDLLFRQLKIDTSAKAKFSKLPNHLKKILQSYADGVNDYVNSLPLLPLEFLITGNKFEPWSPHDCLGLINLMSFFMSLEIMYEPSRQLLYEKYGEEMAHKIFGQRNEFNYEMTTVMNDEDLIKTGIFQNRTESILPEDQILKVGEEFLNAVIEDDIVEMLDGVIKGIKGSNCWVVHGNHTTTGKPLLANDPHLETMIPSMWYQIEYFWKANGTNQRLKGATIPGFPFLLIGRSDYMAWGVTNNIIDNSDFYFETMQNHTYLYDGKWLPLTESNQTIKVRWEEDYHFTQKDTHHGPIIEGLFHLMDPKQYKKLDHAVSLKWTGQIEEDTTVEGLYNLMFAKNVDQIEEEFNKIITTNLNIIYATTDNHIGYYAQGRFIVKNAPNHNHFLNGTDPKNEWIRYYSKEEQPRIRDPAKGFIVSSNNKIATDNLIHNINIAQNSIPRARRITDLLSSGIAKGKKFSPKDFLKMQKDVFDVYSSFIVAPILKIYDTLASKYLTGDEIKEYKNYIDSLRVWNFQMLKESVGASIYISWEHFYLRTYLHEISDDEEIRVAVNMSYMFDHFFMNQIDSMTDSIKEGKEYPNQSFCKIKGINEQGDCVQNLIISFKDAFTYLTSKNGKESKNWAWGKMHKHRFDHKPFSQTPLKYFYERSYVGEGNRRTINVGGVNHLPGNWESWYSPNYRQVIDLSEANDSYYVLDTGISESPFSKHYDDQMILHEHGEFLSMKFESNNKKGIYSLVIQFKDNKNKKSKKQI